MSDKKKTKKLQAVGSMHVRFMILFALCLTGKGRVFYDLIIVREIKGRYICCVLFGTRKSESILRAI